MEILLSFKKKVDSTESTLFPKLVLDESLKSIKKDLGDWAQIQCFESLGTSIMTVCIDGHFVSFKLEGGKLPSKIRKVVIARILDALAKYLGYTHVWLLDYFKVGNAPLTNEQVEDRLFERVSLCQKEAKAATTASNALIKESVEVGMDTHHAAWRKQQRELREATKQLSK